MLSSTAVGRPRGPVLARKGSVRGQLLPPQSTNPVRRCLPRRHGSSGAPRNRRPWFRSKQVIDTRNLLGPQFGAVRHPGRVPEARNGQHGKIERRLVLLTQVRAAPAVKHPARSERGKVMPAQIVVVTALVALYVALQLLALLVTVHIWALGI